MPTNIEVETRELLTTAWPQFQAYRQGTESHRFRGRVLNESDVRAVFERLLTDVLGYSPSQIDREPDFADFLILYRGLKLVVAETKDWEAFRHPNILDNALRQASQYARRHHVKYIFAFDGQTLVLAKLDVATIHVKVECRVNLQTPQTNLFYFTHYGLSKLGKQTLRSLDCPDIGEIENNANDKDYKSHHGVKLHHSCFAYVGDLRAKKTWKMPYRNPDGSVDTKRIDKAVSYLFRAGGYRGATATESSVPEAAQPEVARKLAIAYRELEKWGPDTASKSALVLWDYLYSRGETDLD